MLLKEPKRQGPPGGHRNIPDYANTITPNTRWFPLSLPHVLAGPAAVSVPQPVLGKENCQAEVSSVAPADRGGPAHRGLVQGALATPPSGKHRGS